MVEVWVVALKDITGQTFNRLTVKGLSHQVGSRFYWNCVCSCGAERTVWGADLKRGNTKSCGCLMREQKRAMRMKHGMTGHPAHRSWVHARSRCRDPQNDMYHLYGGRGITFSPVWDDFERFWQDMGPTWSDGLTLDRIDTNGNYEPGNCRWATPAEQASNRRDNIIINTPKGRMTVTEAGREFGISPITIFSRIRYGWSEEELLYQVRPLMRKKG